MTISKDQTKKNGNSSTNQSIKSKFIGQHVQANVNSMVEHILRERNEDAPFTFDDVENLYSYPEWTSDVVGETLRFEGGTEEQRNEFLENFDRLIEESQDLFNEDKISEETHDRNEEIICQAREEFEEATEYSEPQEVYEWWIVSSYLLGKLKELGHPVIEHENIWGRCTTGQAILLDYAITIICADMEILEGQEYSWAK